MLKVLVLLIALEGRDPQAPPAPRSLYVQGGLLLTSLPAGTAFEEAAFSIAPPLKGRGAGLSAGAGRFLTPNIAIEGEFALGPTTSAAQRSTYRTSVEDYFNDYALESRDLLFNGRLRVRPTARGRVEFVAGGGLAMSRVREIDGVRSTSRAPAIRTPISDWSESSQVLTATAGIDVPVQLRGPYELVPGFRVRWVERSAATAVRDGIGGRSYEFGASLRGSFGRTTPAPASGTRGYGQGTLFVTSNPAAVANHRVSPPLGGRAPGVAASGGYFVTPVVAMEGEFVIGGRVSAPQTWSYSSRADYTAEVRDVLVSAGVRGRPAAKSPVEIVACGGFAFTRIRERYRVTTYYLSPGRPQEQPRPDPTYFDRSYQLTGGVDAPIRVSPRVSIVPGFRVRYVRRPEAGHARYVGAGPWAFQAGGTIRIGR